MAVLLWIRLHSVSTTARRAGPCAVGLIDPTSLIELGTLLETPVAFAPEEIVVADLTGVAIQDFEIAKSVWRRLPKR